MLQHTEIFLLTQDKDNSNMFSCYHFIIKLRQVDTTVIIIRLYICIEQDGKQEKLEMA